MSTATSTPNWTLTFSDDFDGAIQTAPNPATWSRDIGGGGWGNNELESYTDGNSNAFLDGMGNLVIEARKELTTGSDGNERPYSSARLLTQGKFTQKFGRIEARIKIPQGQGIWPAFWMLGEDFAEVGWPKCGEIDILESVGKIATTVYGTVHGPGYSGGEAITCQLDSAESFADDFHVYGIEWEPNEIRWFVDDHTYATVKSIQVHDCEWVFNKPYFLLLNLAVGGDWPGYPDESTTFPQRMLIDYVKVFELV